MKNTHCAIISTFICIVVATMLTGGQLFAATRTWIASPGDNLWSTAANWGGTAPVANTDLVAFNDSTGTNLNNDLGVNFALTGIIFNATTNSSYVVTNNAITLNGGITDNSSQPQTLNVSLLMTNGNKTIAVIPGGNLIVGGVIGNYPLAGQNNALILSQNFAAPNQFAASSAVFNYPAAATLTLNGSVANTYTNTTTLNPGTALILDYSNMGTPVNLLSTNAVVLNGAIYSIKGKASGSTFQTNNGNGAITFSTGGSQVVLNPNGGAGTTLKLGNSWTRNAPATASVDVSAGGTLLCTPATVNGVVGYGVIADSTGTGFITTNLATGALVRYTGATALDAAANSLVTNYVTSGSLTMSGSSFAVNSLTLDATSGAGVLDIGGAAVVMTNNSRGILMIGANNYTIQNGMIATNNGEIIMHQMGTGTLNLNAQIGTGTASFTKNGNGTLLINSLSTNSGTDVINRGTVKLGVASTTGAGPLGNTTNGLTINAGGTLDLNGKNLTVGTFSANGIGFVTNSASGTPAVFAIGNGNNRISGYNGTYFAGNLALKIIGNNGTRDDFGNIANAHTGGTIYQSNNLSDRVVNPAEFGSGPLAFNGSGGFQIPSAGLTGWNVVGGFTNAIVVNNGGNLWNYQSNVRSEGAWSGSGTLTINNGFSPNFNWVGSLGAFAGNLILQGSAGQTARYTLSNVDANGIVGSASAAFTLQSLTTGNLNFQYDQTNTVATIQLGDLNTTGNTGTGIIVARNNTVGTAVTLEVGALNANSTFGGSIQDFNGAISVTKVGSGIWTLNGTGNGGNTYSGTTTVSNGLLRVDSNLGGIGAVNVYAPGALGGSGSVAGAVTLSAGSAGILLTNNSTGTLTLSSASGLTLNNGNVLAFDLGVTSDQIALTGGTFTQSGTATVYLSPVSGFGAGTYTLITGAAGISAANFVLGNTLAGYSLSLTNPDASTLALNVTVAAPAAAFWHNRSGTTWNTANNWDTDATGNIALATPPAIPTDVTFAANAASSFNTTLGADFNVHSLTLSTPNNVTIGGANTLTLSTGLVNDWTAGSNVLNTKIALGTDQTWVNNSANSLVVNSNISGARALTIAAGSTNIVLNAANSYSGGTIINSGTLTLGNPTDTLADSGAVIVNGGNLDIGTVTDTVGAVILTNGAIVGVGGTLTASSYYAENGTITANLAGSVTFTKGSGGTVLLSGTNTYSGATTVAGGGTLQLGNNAALGSSSSLTVSGGSTLDLNGFNVNRPIAGITGNSTLANSSINPSSINVDWANGNQAFTIAGSGNIALQAISGTAPWAVTQNSSGTVTYGGTNDNSFMGLIVNSGTAVLAKPTGSTGHAVGGNISGGSDLVLNNGTVFIASGGNGDQLFNNRFITVNAGVLDLNGQSEAVDGINGSGGMVTNSAATVGTFTLGSFNGSPGTFSGTIEGPLAVTKVGAGLQSLAGINTYTGNTTISGGTLALTEPGSIANSAIISIANGTLLDVTGRADQTLTLNSGQTLTGSGSINGKVTSASGSVINPGGINAVGTLRVTNDIILGGKLTMELNRSLAQKCDQLVSVTGTITYGGTLLVTNIGPALNVTNTFQLFPGAVTAFTAITLATNDATGNIYTWTNKVAIDGSIALLSVTPPVNLAPTNLVATLNGNQLILSWPADHTGWHLQTQTNLLTVGLNTNWVTIPNTDTANSYTNTIDATKPTVFYRMVYP